MTDWTAGYVADVGYTYGYYNELNPLRANLALLDAGLHCPDMGVACELGFGQGLSANLHAAASPTHWFGTDFNPAQAGFAQELAAAAGAGARLYDQSFTEFAQLSDLPDFDYIGLHGIWSWISDENRHVIVDLVRRKLKVGGVLYISYNTQPGWAAMLPMRELLAEHAEVMGAAGQGVVARVDGALGFAEQLMAAKPAYASANPQIEVRLKKLKEQSRNYLAHEYFNRDWLPMTFSRMRTWLGPAKLDYACSAHLIDHIDALNLSAEQQALLKQIADPMFRETVRDFCVNQQFRRDYWVKGARKLNAVELAERRRAQRVVLALPRDEVSLKASGSLGEASMQEGIYKPILDLLADHQPHSLGEIESALAGEVNLGQLMQVVLVLSAAGSLFAAQDSAAAERSRPSCAALNAHLLNKARGSDDIARLASPVTGGGITVTQFQQLFLLARQQGLQQPEDWARYAWQQLQAQGQRLLKAGAVLAHADENLAELTLQARDFANKRLAVLQALGLT